jgi:hypothetical protein
MKAFYEKQGKQVFDYLPVTFHVKKYNDQAWKEFSCYYEEDIKTHPGEKRLWIVKPGENSNRGNGITIHSEFEKIRQLMEVEMSDSANAKKTFIIQKYIDKPFLYNKRKFDIRCYMLLVRLVPFPLFRTAPPKDTGITRATYAPAAMTSSLKTQRTPSFISPTMPSRSTQTSTASTRMATSLATTTSRSISTTPKREARVWWKTYVRSSKG